MAQQTLQAKLGAVKATYFKRIEKALKAYTRKEPRIFSSLEAAGMKNPHIHYSSSEQSSAMITFRSKGGGPESLSIRVLYSGDDFYLAAWGSATIGERLLHSSGDSPERIASWAIFQGLTAFEDAEKARKRQAKANPKKRKGALKKRKAPAKKRKGATKRKKTATKRRK